MTAGLEFGEQSRRRQLPELIILPLAHFLDRYRKAWNDMLIVDSNVATIEGQIKELKQQLAWFKGQQDLVHTEFETAEIALRSAVVSPPSSGAAAAPIQFEKLGGSPAEQGPLGAEVAEEKPGIVAELREHRKQLSERPDGNEDGA